ncbi:MAG: SGNH/GDSL hydrolase family protein [Bacteroidetes bacterium]|jgi:lysophospholipase L1-like esterase|nr:SGNH/GDSL hydrolase family protein [Bacteroidota bacterium]MCL5034435.1 SGNH/GDSL hydrolase family protein [Bacteroidota bacterium]
MKALGPRDKIIFLGDSITEQGGGPRGYVTIVTDSLRAKYGEHAPAVINAGISGNKVTDLQARLDRDVLSKKPTVVVVYIGINDVWHFASPGLGGTPKDVYEAGLRDVVSRVRATGAAVILCTPSVIGEKHNGGNPQDTMLDEYSGISREIAKETGVSLCDLHKIFVAYLRLNNQDNVRENILTIDGVHLNDGGNKLVARSIMESIGL